MESEKKEKKPSSKVPIYVCGLGRWGRLGLGSDTKTRHHMVPMKSMRKKHVVKAASGAGHSYVVVCENKSNNNENTVWSWGKCNFGQLGHNEQEGDKDAPTEIIAFKGLGVVEVIGGDSYGLAITAEGRVYSWGSGFYGSLGHGNESHVFVPTLIESIQDVKMIKGDAGMAHSILLSENGELYTFGRNDFGQLATGTKVSKKVPFKITFFGDKKIIDVSCGSMHSICLDSEGKVYAWGSNKYHEVTPKIEAYVDRLLLPTLIPFENPCIRVGAGLHFCWAIDNQNHLWMWGDNLGGQLAQTGKAIIENPTKVVDSNGSPLLVSNVASTQYASYCITTTGKIYHWGELTLWQDKIEGRTIPNSDLCVPKLEDSVENTKPIDIACGCNHVVLVVAI